MSAIKQMSIIEQFDDYASNASYHYADDSGKEWGSANINKQKALELFDKYPEFQDQMREVAKNQLWSLDMARPKGAKNNG